MSSRELLEMWETKQAAKDYHDNDIRDDLSPC